MAKIKIKKKALIQLLLEESRRGAEWGPLTEKGAKELVEDIKSVK